MNIDDTSDQNSEYWNELCGTNIARVLGVNDSSRESLQKFDRWFFDFYPYLKDQLKTAVLPGNQVLEVGLGYGTVATYLMEQGLTYTGLDIAAGPVEMANLRARYLNNDQSFAVLGNVLELNQFPDDRFDSVVAIGSLHHTGDFNRAIAEVVRVTKPGGVIVGMVYSLFSGRNWILKPQLMLASLRKNTAKGGIRIRADKHLRWLSDHNSAGEAAPATEYFSRRALHNLLKEYGDVEIRARNLDQIGFFRFSSPRLRRVLMATPLSRLLGLDLYFTIRVKK